MGGAARETKNKAKLGLWMSLEIIDKYLRMSQTTLLNYLIKLSTISIAKLGNYKTTTTASKLLARKYPSMCNDSYQHYQAVVP